MAKRIFDIKKLSVVFLLLAVAAPSAFSAPPTGKIKSIPTQFEIKSDFAIFFTDYALLTAFKPQFSSILDYPEYSDYSGNEIFSTSTFLDVYEGIAIGSIISSPVNIDAWTGVSTTPSGMRTALEGVAQYHIDNIGGGN